MIKHAVRATAVAATLALTACASTGPMVRTDQDPSADFGRYTTWGYYKPDPAKSPQPGYSTWVEDRIKQGVRSEMEIRGYRYSETTPDLWVNTRQSTAIRTEMVPAPMWGWGMDYGYSWGRRGFRAGPRWGLYGGYGMGGPWGPWGPDWGTQTYAERTVSVDLVDARLNRLVWTGDASDAALRSRSAQERAAEVDRTINAIFAHYPYRAGSNQPVAPAEK